MTDRRFYYGYLMIPLAMALQVASSPGQTFAFSAFTPSFRADLGLTDVSLTLAYALGTLLASIPLSRIGPATDRYGLRPLVLGCIVALSLVCIAASRIAGWWTLLLTFTLLRFLGQGSMSLLAGHSMSMWFRDFIGRVGAVMAIGMAGALALVPGWVQHSIDAVGWRTTYVRIGVTILAIGLPTFWWLFRNQPEDVGQLIDGRRHLTSDADSPVDAAATKHQASITFEDAIRGRTFYLLGIVTTLWASIGTGVVFYQYDIAATLGVDKQRASETFLYFGTAMLIAQIAGSVAADFLRLNRMLALGVALLAGGMLFLATAGTTNFPSREPVHSLRLFALLFGAGQGLLIAITSAAWVKYYGRDHLGRIRGAVWCATVAGSGLGPLLLGASRQYGESFTPMLVAMTASLIVATPLAWLATPPAIKSSMARPVAIPA